MRLIILILVSSFFSIASRSQSNIVPDSLLLETCKTIVNSKQPDDSLKIAEAFSLHLTKLFSNLPDSEFTKADYYVFVRLQKFCPAFKKYLDKINPPQDDWVRLEVKPDTKLDKRSSRDFLNHKDYYYFDLGHDTVKLSLLNNVWVDHFKDGTYSKLKFNWISDSEFEISFIESNNSMRSNLSKPGEKYRYQLIEKFPGYYLVCLNMPELKTIATFKIYYH